MQRYYIFCVCQSFLAFIYEKMFCVPAHMEKSVSKSVNLGRFLVLRLYILMFNGMSFDV